MARVIDRRSFPFEYRVLSVSTSPDRTHRRACQAARLLRSLGYQATAHADRVYTEVERSRMAAYTAIYGGSILPPVVVKG